jgi:hypothetical protein
VFVVAKYARPRRPEASAISRRSSRLAAARFSRGCAQRSRARLRKERCQGDVREQEGRGVSMDFMSQEHVVPRDGPKDLNAGG